MLRFVLIVCFLAASTYSHYPRYVCKNSVTPGYQASGQKSTAPYSFFGENSVKSGDKIKLILYGDEFLGFMLQAQNEKGEPLGTFKVIEETKSQLLKCKAEGDTLINVDLHRKPMMSVEFEWLAPEDYKGPVNFVASVVKDYATFWIDKINKEVTVL